MNQPGWLDYLTAFGSVATPVFVLILTAVGWRLRARLERQFALEDKLREDRIGTYNKILEPFILLFMSEFAWRRDPKNKEVDKNAIAIDKMLSLDYRSVSFRLSLVGSDPVVRAYNNLMQCYFEFGALGSGAGPKEGEKIMSMVAQLLLEIRRSMGNETTKLDHWDMLEWFIKDVRQHAQKPHNMRMYLTEPRSSSWWKVGCRGDFSELLADEIERVMREDFSFDDRARPSERRGPNECLEPLAPSRFHPARTRSRA